MANHEPPSHDELLRQLSAFLDGELPEAEEPGLLRALEQDPALLCAFQEMSSLPWTSTAALSTADAHALTESILAACTPEAVALDTTGVTALSSMAADDALDAAGVARLQQAVGAGTVDAMAWRDFACATEAVGANLAAWPSAPAIQAAVAALPARLETAFCETERFGELFSAAMDDELSPEETREFTALTTETRQADGLAWVAASEVWGPILKAPVDSPDADRAGRAALQAIDAWAQQAALAASADKERPGAPQPRWSLTALWGRLLPALAAAAAALTFAWLPLTREAPGPTPPGGRVAMESAREIGALALLADNRADVQTLDSGTHLAAVFATEASQITIIWVSEPDPLDMETGT